MFFQIFLTTHCPKFRVSLTSLCCLLLFLLPGWLNTKLFLLDQSFKWNKHYRPDRETCDPIWISGSHCKPVSQDARERHCSSPCKPAAVLAATSAPVAHTSTKLWHDSGTHIHRAVAPPVAHTSIRLWHDSGTHVSIRLWHTTALGCGYLQILVLGFDIYLL